MSFSLLPFLREEGISALLLAIDYIQMSLLNRVSVGRLARICDSSVSLMLRGCSPLFIFPIIVAAFMAVKRQVMFRKSQSSLCSDDLQTIENDGALKTNNDNTNSSSNGGTIHQNFEKVMLHSEVHWNSMKYVMEDGFDADLHAEKLINHFSFSESVNFQDPQLNDR